MQVLFLSVLILSSCAKKENGAVEPRRTKEDSINIVTILKSDDPSLAKNDFDLWLQYYPDEIDRVFPEDATTVLGLVSRKYFQAPAPQKAQWGEMMDRLLALGANPNIFFPYENQRRGLLHLAIEQADQAFVRKILEQQGTIDPPLVLSCENPTVPARAATFARSSQKPIDLNLPEEGSGLTPLHYAVKSANPDQTFIEYLLLQGASPDINNQALGLSSPYQMVAGNPSLSPVFERYSGAQIRYQSRMNSFLNGEIEKDASERKTLLDLAKAYQDFVEKEGFQSVQDIDRLIDMCQSREKLNLLGYATKYLLPSISPRVVQAVKVRNDSMKSLISDYGASLCLPENLSIRDNETGSFRDIALKDFIKEALVAHTSVASAPVKNYNRMLWCEIIKPKAIEGACWNEALDETLAPGLDCPTS